MKLVKQSYEILTEINSKDILKKIELAGRTCYKSEGRITEDSYVPFVKMLISRGHLSVIEHESVSVRFICSRFVSHELVRHRLCSFSQESTRYVDYGKDNEITMIEPSFWDKDSREYAFWFDIAQEMELNYRTLRDLGVVPERARYVLGDCIKTEIVVTANLREWREVLKQRTAVAANEQMREIMCPLLAELKQKLPIIFDDIG